MIHKIYLGIPEWLAQHLANGTMVRDAAGVIRWAKGQSSGGQIVAHLRESTTSASTNAATGLNVATIGLQMANLAYMKARFDQLQYITEQILSDVRALSATCDHILELEYQSWLRVSMEACEHYRRYLRDGDVSYLNRACEKFTDGFSNIKQLVRSHTPERMAAQIRRIDFFLQIDHLCAALEQQALAAVGRTPAQRNDILSDRLSFYRETHEKLGTIPRPSIQLPSLDIISNSSSDGYFIDAAKTRNRIMDIENSVHAGIWINTALVDEELRAKYLSESAALDTANKYAVVCVTLEEPPELQPQPVTIAQISRKKRSR
jgi:hypothetical protein